MKREPQQHYIIQNGLQFCEKSKVSNTNQNQDNKDIPKVLGQHIHIQSQQQNPKTGTEMDNTTMNYP